MKLGVNLGYAPPGTNPADLVPIARLAEALGYDSAWAAEAWGTDAVTPLAWLGAPRTGSSRPGIMQMPARTPANTAMTAATLDLIRAAGSSSASAPPARRSSRVARPAVRKPIGAHPRVLRFVRAVLRREAVEPGEHYPIPEARCEGARQTAQADLRPAPRRDPDLLAPTARRTSRGDRDRRRLAAALRRERSRGLAESLAGAPRLRIACPSPSSSPTTSRRSARIKRYSRSTSVAWARRRRTSTTSSAATAWRRRPHGSRSSTSAGAARGDAAVPDALVDAVSLAARRSGSATGLRRGATPRSPPSSPAAATRGARGARRARPLRSCSPGRTHPKMPSPRKPEAHRDLARGNLATSQAIVNSATASGRVGVGRASRRLACGPSQATSRQCRLSQS